VKFGIILQRRERVRTTSFFLLSLWSAGTDQKLVSSIPGQHATGRCKYCQKTMDAKTTNGTTLIDAPITSAASDNPYFVSTKLAKVLRLGSFLRRPRTNYLPGWSLHTSNPSRWSRSPFSEPLWNHCNQNSSFSVAGPSRPTSWPFTNQWRWN
jgi:hypothetical protein